MILIISSFNVDRLGSNIVDESYGKGRQKKKLAE